MKSKRNQLIVPVQFTISGTCSEVSTAFVDLIDDVCYHTIHSHARESSNWPPFEQNQQTVAVLISNTEFRISLDLLVEKKIGQIEYRELVRLLEATVLNLFEATRYKVFETAWLQGQYQGVSFQAWWTLYSFVDKTVGTCGKHPSVSITEQEL
ncbi:hypothetical protein DL98DRAFT_518309 [Cadophora sp. DSE1049]|nr:hypothetical protein DL98DRAFT_518309 [Cadophora sp. DSE1049]